MDKPQPTLDEYHRFIGKLENEAAASDLIMFSAFRVLLGCTNSIANAIYYTLDSLPARSALLTRVADALGDETEKELIQKIIKANEKANNQRKQFSHAFAAFEGGISNFKVFNPKSGRFHLPSEQNLHDAISHVYSAIQESHLAYQQLCEKRGASPIIDLQ
jgi:hypothetical protein